MSDTRDTFHDEPTGQGDQAVAASQSAPAVEQERGPTPHDNLAAYALGSLDIDERRLFELHLFICRACRADLTAHERVVNLLPYGLTPQQPPAGARDRLLTRLGTDASESPTIAMPLVDETDAPAIANAEAPTISQAALVAERDEVETTTVTVNVGQSRRGYRMSLASIGWAAALLVVIAAGLFIAAWAATGPHPSPAVQVFARLPGGRVLALRGTGVPTASGNLYVIDGGRQAELAIDALPPLPPNRVYQLWFAEPDQTVRTSGAFTVNPQGRTVVALVVPTPLERVRAVAVTQEPAPGLVSPTGTNLLDWTP